MFDQLFNCLDTLTRHQSSPFLDARVRYLQHCRDVGSPRGTLRRKAGELLVIIDQMNLQPEGAIRSEDIEAAAHRWAYRQPSHYKLKDAEEARKRFVRAAKQWFEFLGRLQAPPTPAYQCFIEEFATHMEREKGLSPMTIRSECGHVLQFFSRHCTDGRQLAAISIRQVDEAIAQKGSQDHCTRASIKFYADSLRAFFRYAETKGWCRSGVAAAIMAPSVYQHEQIPLGPSAQWRRHRPQQSPRRGHFHSGDPWNSGNPRRWQHGHSRPGWPGGSGGPSAGSDTVDMTVLNTFADESGGKAWLLSGNWTEGRANQVQSALDEIAAELRSQYSIGYYPSPLASG
jgi:hypothetical protein